MAIAYSKLKHSNTQTLKRGFIALYIIALYIIADVCIPK